MTKTKSLIGYSVSMFIGMVALGVSSHMKVIEQPWYIFWPMWFAIILGFYSAGLFIGLMRDEKEKNA